MPRCHKWTRMHTRVSVDDAGSETKSEHKRIKVSTLTSQSVLYRLWLHLICHDFFRRHYIAQSLSRSDDFESTQSPPRRLDRLVARTYEAWLGPGRSSIAQRQLGINRIVRRLLHRAAASDNEASPSPGLRFYSCLPHANRGVRRWLPRLSSEFWTFWLVSLSPQEYWTSTCFDVAPTPGFCPSHPVFFLCVSVVVAYHVPKKLRTKIVPRY